MSHRISLLLVLLLGAACGVPPGVETLAPRFDGTRVMRLRGNVLPTPPAASGAIELNVERVGRPDRDPEFALLVAAHSDALRIRPGASLHLLIGTDSIRLTRDARVAEWDLLAAGVREQARYPVEADVLRRMAEAEAVGVVVVGAAWRERRRLSPGNLAAIRSFVSAAAETPSGDAPAQ